MDKPIDAQLTFIHGVNNGISPHFLGDGFFVHGENSTCRDGEWAMRNSIDPLTVTFADKDIENLFKTGRVQGSHAVSFDGTGYILLCISGVFCILDLSNMLVSAYWALTQWSSEVTQVNFATGHRFTIAQNGVNTPVIFDGLSARFSDPDKESKLSIISSPGDLDHPKYATGEIGTAFHIHFSHNRFITARKNGNQVIMHDILVPDDEENVLLDTERRFLGEAGGFYTPPSLGPIQGFGNINQHDTSLGIGSLLVFCENGIMSIDLTQPRESWQNSVSIIRIVFNGTGSVGPWSIVPFFEDIFFFSSEGLKSLRQSRANAQRYDNSGLSKPVSGYLESTRPAFNKYTRIQHINNRLYITVNPSPLNQTGVKHSHLMVLDFDRNGQQGERPMAYDGLIATDNLVSMNRVDSMNSEHLILTHHGEEGIYFSELVEDTGRPVKSELITRAFTADDLIQFKSFAAIDIDLAPVCIKTTISMYYRIDGNREWEEGIHSSVEPEEVKDKPFLKAKDYCRVRINIPQDTNACRRIQFKFVLEGKVKMIHFVVQGSRNSSNASLATLESEDQPCLN